MKRRGTALTRPRHIPKPLAEAAERYGWTCDGVSNGSHIRWSRRGRCTFTSATPSDHRSIKNAISLFRRIAREQDAR